MAAATMAAHLRLEDSVYDPSDSNLHHLSRTSTHMTTSTDLPDDYRLTRAGYAPHVEGLRPFEPPECVIVYHHVHARLEKTRRWCEAVLAQMQELRRVINAAPYRQEE